MGVLAGIALGIVLLLLAATLVVQFRAPRGRGRLLDTLALTPQWKFFAQSVLASDAAPLADIHVVVRDRLDDGRIGGWQAALSPGERRLLEAVWNPALRSIGMLLSLADDLGSDPRAAAHERTQQSLPYLVLLRHSFSECPRPQGAESRQFALIRASGRGDRALSICFVSAFHRW